MTERTSYLTADDLPRVPFVLEGVSSRFLSENKIIPLDFKDNVLRIAIADPADSELLDAIRSTLAADIVACACEEKAINEYIERVFGQESQNIDGIIENIDETGLSFVKEDEEDVGYLKDLAAEAPIIRLVNVLVSRAVENRASDIHVEPYADELKVRYRIDGVLHDVESVPKRLQPAIISRVKIMAKLNIAERRLPQDGRIRLKVVEKDIDFRVSTVPVLYGESIVMRILDRDNILIDLSSLGFPPQTLSRFQELIQLPNGILLVTGPTGSGKTTTLYGALEKINSPDKKIVTVEDPVEYQLKGVNQIQVKPQINLTFPNILRHIVRQDPDIIMIGEIRDLETAEIAIQSALTGHLVFSTLHTNDAPSSITRLVDIGVEDFLLASTIRGILAQRLVRVICPSCREKDPSSAHRDAVQRLGIVGPLDLCVGKGCERCAHTGYHGRMGIFELLVVDDAIRRLMIKDPDMNLIRESARRAGMKTLLEEGAIKAAAGMTAMSEVLRVTHEV